MSLSHSDGANKTDQAKIVYGLLVLVVHFFFYPRTSTFQLLDKPWSQVSSLLPPGSCLQYLSRIDRVRQSHCSSIFRRVLQLALSRFPQVNLRTRKGPRIYTSMHSRGFELTKLTYTRLENNLIRHRRDRHLNRLGRA